MGFGIERRGSASKLEVGFFKPCRPEFFEIHSFLHHFLQKKHQLPECGDLRNRNMSLSVDFGGPWQTSCSTAFHAAPCLPLKSAASWITLRPERLRGQAQHNQLPPPSKRGILGRRRAGNRLTPLQAENSADEAVRKGGRKGFYVRPSKAVEMGGGFYVPGLDASKFRVVFALLAFAFLGANRAVLPGYVPLQNQVISEALTSFAAVALLYHAISENIEKMKSNESEKLVVTPTDQPKQAAAPSSIMPSETLLESRAEDESWLVASALQIVPTSTFVATLQEAGVIAAYAPSISGGDAGQKAFAACVKAIGNKAAIEIERSEQGEEGIRDIFSVVPAQCNKVLICGGEMRVLMVDMPANPTENQVLWLSQIASLPPLSS